MGEAVEMVKALISPGEKLIDGMFKAFGKIYEPHHLKKMADAQSYQIKKIGEAMRENSDIPIEYNSNGITLSSSDYDDFVKRTQGRLAFQELRKQENIETVAGKALNYLEGKPKVDNEPIDVDWLVRFFSSVESIGNEEMQELWAKLLAGEIQHSGSFSLRTMDKLSSLSQREAMIFQEILCHCVCGEFNSYVMHKEYNPDKYSHGSIILMGECGLVNSDSNLIVNVDITSAFSAPILWSDKNVITARVKEGKKIIKVPVYPLTQVGKELSRIIGYNMSTQEIEVIKENLKRENQDVIFKSKRIVEHREDGSFSYEIDEEDLKERETRTKN